MGLGLVGSLSFDRSTKGTGDVGGGSRGSLLWVMARVHVGQGPGGSPVPRVHVAAERHGERSEDVFA